MTKEREADVAKKIDRWLKHQIVLGAAGIKAKPRNEFECVLAKMQDQIANEEQAAARPALDAACCCVGR